MICMLGQKGYETRRGHGHCKPGIPNQVEETNLKHESQMHLEVYDPGFTGMTGKAAGPDMWEHNGGCSSWVSLAGQGWEGGQGNAQANAQTLALAARVWKTLSRRCIIGTRGK